MAHGDVIAQYERMSIMGDVQQAKVLNIGPVANADMVDISADDSMKPDAGFGSDDHVSDDNRSIFDKRAGSDSWSDASIRFQHARGPFAK
jgi:hypothetical protein